MQLAVIEEITIKKTGEVRQVVGRLPCECGQSLYVLQGKKNLYEYCTACGVNLNNGKAKQERLIAKLTGVTSTPPAAVETPPAEETEKTETAATPPPETPPAVIPPLMSNPADLRGKSLLQIFLEWKPFGD